MKTLKYLSIMLVMLACSVGFASCSDDDDDDNGGSNGSITGTWEASGYTLNGHEGTLRVVFSGNKGTMTAIYNDGTDPDTYNFEYELKTDRDGDTSLTIVWTGTKSLIYSGNVPYYITMTSTRLVWGNITYTRK